MNFTTHFDPSRSVLQEIKLPDTEHTCRIYIKRDDLVHPEVSGNKWRKLKYNLIEAEQKGYDTILTFGGAYSNHIYAVAAAGHLFGFNTVGIIRGEEYTPLNPTLSFAVSRGMELHYISRMAYRRREEPEFQNWIKKKFGDVYKVPDGGSNINGVKGAAELPGEIDIGFDYICSASGTGGTAAGIIAGLDGKAEFIGFPVLKGGEFLYDDITGLIKRYNGKTYDNWRLETDWHFGGYAKINLELIRFINDFYKTNRIRLDPVYTGKMMYGLRELVRTGTFGRDDTIIAVHTGGLQGAAGMKDKINKLLANERNGYGESG